MEQMGKSIVEVDRWLQKGSGFKPTGMQVENPASPLPLLNLTWGCKWLVSQGQLQ
jgi:hypothetical protein